MKNSRLVFFVFFITASSCAKLPSSFKKCERKQGDFNACLSKAIAHAVQQLNTAKPELGLPSIDPLAISTLTVEAGTNAVGFTQYYKNVKLFGLSKFTSLEANMDFGTKVLTLDIVFVEIKAEFEYEINGKILLLPITGKGPGLLVIDKPEVRLIFALEEYDRKGKKHFKVTNTKADYHTVGGLQITFNNLFNGDKTLGDNVNKVINDNWREVFVDVKAGYENAAAQTIGGLFSNFLAKVSISELFGAA